MGDKPSILTIKKNAFAVEESLGAALE